MNVIVLSDLHANDEALRPLKPVLREADLVLCLGDFIGYYCQVNQVLDFMRTLPTICVRGNHDEFLLSGCPAGVPDSVRFGIEYADRVIDPGHRAWLAGLPLVWGGMTGSRSVLLAHGSPFSPLEDYLFPNRIPEIPLDRFAFDLLAFGQTHRPYLDSSRRPHLLNPGSVGQSRHEPAVACAARWDPDNMTVEQLGYAYDPAPVISLAVANGAGDWVAKHLL